MFPTDCLLQYLMMGIVCAHLQLPNLILINLIMHTSLCFLSI